MIIDPRIIAIDKATRTTIGDGRVARSVQRSIIAIDDYCGTAVNFRLAVVIDSDIVTSKDTNDRTLADGGRFTVVVEGDVVTLNRHDNTAIQRRIAALIGDDRITKINRSSGCAINNDTGLFSDMDEPIIVVAPGDATCRIYAIKDDGVAVVMDCPALDYRRQAIRRG